MMDAFRRSIVNLTILSDHSQASWVISKWGNCHKNENFSADLKGFVR